MSGICGIVNFDGTPADRAMLRQMAEAAMHRAPDGMRWWALGGAGLAHLALHLSPESRRERQPLVSSDGDLVITADARLDNRDELSRTLAAEGFVCERVATDVDLLLAAYRRWGQRCPVHLLGDFAFAVYDMNERLLFAVRDPMAMRALYYRAEPRRLLFATEVKQILAVPDVPVRLFEPAVAGHLAGPFGSPEWTFYEGIAQLPPAHALLVNEAGHRTWRYWDHESADRIQYANEREYGDQFRELFKDAVRWRLRTNKPVGIFLSGGMDSGSAASTAGWLLEHETGHTHSFHAYSWAFDELPDCDERHISDGIVRQYTLPLTNVAADSFWPLKDYPSHGPDRDEPFLCVYQALIEHTLTIAQAEGMGLMLSGDRGDEMVGDWIFDHLGLFRSGQWLSLWNELRAHRSWSGQRLRAILLQYLVGPLVSPVRSKLHMHHRHPPVHYPDWVRPEFARQVGLEDIIRRTAPNSSVTGFARRGRYERIFSFSGARIATTQERTHARFGLGFADPWSDRRIANFVLAIPQWRVQQVREPKGIARRAMRGIMPEEVRRTAGKIIPGRLFNRGFKDRSKDTIYALVTNSQAAARGFLNEGALRAAYESFLRGEPQRYDFWWPLTLEMWLRRWWS